MTRHDLTPQAQHHLSNDGWNNPPYITKDWEITDDSDLPREIAGDLIAANEIVGIAIEDIAIQ